MKLDTGGARVRQENSRNYYIAIIMVFILSRLFFFLLGIRFDDSTLGDFWQYLDPLLLKNNLLESLFYLHSQPPIFNLYLGIILKIGAGFEQTLFHITYLCFGLVLYLSLYQIQIEFRIRRIIAFILATIVIISPAIILYENFLLYTYPVASMVVLSGLFLNRYFVKKRRSDLIFFFVLATMLIFTRSLFHLVWIFGALLLILSFNWENRRKILTIAALPVLFCVLLFAKNAVLFDSFASSSWLGMNLSKLTTWQIPVEERARLINEGTLTKTALVHPFEAIPPYVRLGIVKIPPERGIAVLDYAFKTGGGRNLNHSIYPAIERQYRQDAFWVIRNRPLEYLGGIGDALKIFFVPSSAFVWLRPNLEKIASYDRLWSHILYGQIEYCNDLNQPKKTSHIGILIIFWYLALLIYGTWYLFKHRRSLLSINPAVLYLILSISYIAVIGNFFELGENNRFRVLTDPVAVILTGIVINDLIDRYRNKKGEHAGREILPPFIHPLAVKAPPKLLKLSGRQSPHVS